MKTCLLTLVVQWSSKFLVLLTFFSFFQNISFAQECITPDADPQEAMNYPWFGDSEYLPSFMDSLTAAEDTPSQSPSVSSVVPNIKWRIPVKFWIFTTGDNVNPANLLDDGITPNLPEERELQRLLDDANNAFRNTEVPSKIQFYMREAERVVNEETAPSEREIARFTQNGFGTRFHLC